MFGATKPSDAFACICIGTTYLKFLRYILAGTIVFLKTSQTKKRFFKTMPCVYCTLPGSTLIRQDYHSTTRYTYNDNYWLLVIT